MAFVEVSFPGLVSFFKTRGAFVFANISENDCGSGVTKAERDLIAGVTKESLLGLFVVLPESLPGKRTVLV